MDIDVSIRENLDTGSFEVLFHKNNPGIEILGVPFDVRNTFFGAVSPKEASRGVIPKAVADHLTSDEDREKLQGAIDRALTGNAAINLNCAL
jgi:hypothetical protein